MNARLEAAERRQKELRQQREAAGGKVKTSRLTPTEAQGLPLVGEGKGVWVRPAFDGLRVFVSDKKRVRDEEYDC